MSTISRPKNPEEKLRVKSLFDDIRAIRGVISLITYGIT